MKDQWVAYSKHYTMPEASGYEYYTDENTTDKLESIQDAFKRRREVATISSAITNNPDVLLDFGCGIGRNLEILRNQSDHGALIIGVEPDEKRARAASLNESDALIVHSDKRFLVDAPMACEIDYVLCCQVLGHVPTDETAEILTSLFDSLSGQGVVQILVPFVNANQQTSGVDFFHYCDLTKLPHEENFRVALTEEQFNSFTSRRLVNQVLPVRAFAVDVPIVSDANEIPLALAHLPPSLASIIPAGFTATTSIYSVHSWQAGQPYIGDISVTISKGV